MPVSTCPSVSDLEKLAAGLLPPTETETLVQHLEGCQTCLGRLATLSSKDTLADLLARAKTLAGEPQHPLLASVIERLSRLGQPPAAAPAHADCPSDETVLPLAAASGAGLSPGKTPSQANSTQGLPPQAGDHEPLDFLRPAQQADELGRLGQYRILKRLGAGGMGMVLLAEDTLLQRKVALKLMLPQFAASAASRERFLREARAAASIEHEHIVPIFQVGADNNVPFLAMPFLKGEPLDVRLGRAGKLPVAEALRIAREMAEGLAAAHANHLIHRDIKPGNVWLEASPGRKSGEFRVKLLDFGLARVEDDTTHLTQTGAIVGTPAYMAPEQARHDKIDGRADLFSLGCVLYQMLTGRRPFKGDDTISLLMSLATDTPPSPTSLTPDVPDAVSALTMRLLAKQPADRPASATDVAETLRSLAPGGMQPDQTQSLANPRLTQPQPPRRRRPLRLAAAAVLLLALAGGGYWLAQIVIIRDKDGNAVASFKVPDKGSVEIRPDDGKKPPLAAAPLDPAWLKAVAALPPDKQVDAVSAKLKERNPGFDGKVTPTINEGVVTGMEFLTDHITYISPVRALTGLRMLKCDGTLKEGHGMGQLADLSPLKDMKLLTLECSRTRVDDLTPLKDMKLTDLRFAGTPVADLSPLKGMPLTSLCCGYTPVADLSPLKDMKLTYLSCPSTKVADLSPLKDMKLWYLHCGGTKVSDLSPLKGMKLRSVVCFGTPVADLSPLKDMKLTYLDCHGTRVSDLSPLKDMPVKELHCDFKAERDAAILRSIKTLESINNKPAAEFWNGVESAAQPIPEAWFKQVAAMPAEKQVEAVAAKLKERNPGFDGKVTHKIEKGVVTSLSLVSNEVADITPVRALAGLKSLSVQGIGFLNGRQKNGKLTNLTPLAGMNLTHLNIGGNQVSDLSPLQGMKLNDLSCNDTNVADLKPLKGMPLVRLTASGAAVADLSPLKDSAELVELDIGMTRVKDLTPLKDLKKLKKLTAFYMEVSDLTPLKGLPLTQLRVEGTRVSDLSPLKSMKLVSLRLHQTKVADLSPLKDMKLEDLTLYGTTVTDLSPLKGMPLKDIRLDFKPLRDAALLRSIKTLERINDKPAAEFWKEAAARTADRKP